MTKRIKKLSQIGALAALSALSGWAQPVGQWDFEGNLNGTVGAALTFADTLTEQGAAFGTTTALGIPNIGGAEAKVMKVPAATNATMGLLMPVNAGASGGELVNTYTLIMDVLFPAESNSKWRALLSTEPNPVINADADFFINAGNGIGISGSYSGTILPNTWHRIGMVMDQEAGRIFKYIDGMLVGSQALGKVDDRFALGPFQNALLFADDDGESALGYVNSVQLRDVALTLPQMRALGAPAAAGIPQTIPPIPSGIEKWIPAGAFANRNTSVGATIALGSATIQDSSISLTLNGTAIASPTITRDAEFVTVRSGAQNLTPGVAYTAVVAYTDSLGGAKRFTNVFTAALFYEDFDSITLGPKVDEGLDGEAVWTNMPPTGWSLNNTNMAGFESLDEDGDGYRDGDGVTEWWGWGFANRDWWAQTAGDQRRTEFTLANGNVAIADPDEWDDRSHDVGLFNSIMTTPEISLTGVAANTAFLRFQSSWRPEGKDDGGPNFPVDENEQPINNQTAVISISFDGGTPVQVLKWDSISGSPTFHTDMPNETVTVPINNPAGAQKMRVSFALLLGANDWWWAVDEIVVNAGAAPPTIATQPGKVEVNEGAAASLSVAANGSDLTYQWYKGIGTGRTAVSGATAATLSFPAVKVENAGYYTVDIKNAVGTVTSGLGKIAVLPKSAGRLVLLDENFDALPLGPNVDEGVAGDTVWTKTGPTGWTIDDTGVPGAGTDTDGVTEWAGWSFANRAWWAQTGGDQQRTLFVKGTGTSAIADSDEWDDVGHAAGNMDTSLKTKNIPLAGVKANTVILKFDSSWRPEDPQKASVLVSFDGGTPVEVLGYHSTPTNPNYRPDEVSETIALRIANPGSAQNMQVIFRYYDTRNNWWWAIDNIQVLGDPAPLFFEDFESLVLGPNVDEALAGTAVWTSTTPTGWSVDNTTTPGLNDPAIGVREWEGWNFANRAWWAQTAGGQRRAEFLKGIGTIAIADGDEWDDKGSPAALGKMNTFLSTRPINITGQAANSLVLTFDSSWRDEPDQKVNIRVAYNGGAPVEVLRWESVAGANFHDDNPNETVRVALNNPAGATSLVITFGYLDSGNNWWWAIDNVEVNPGTIAPGEVRITSAKRNGANVEITVSGSGTLSLEKKTSLSDTTWTGVTATAVGGVFTVPADGANGFFRVKSQ